jgi:hypothetical protein
MKLAAQIPIRFIAPDGSAIEGMWPRAVYARARRRARASSQTFEQFTVSAIAARLNAGGSK